MSKISHKTDNCASSVHSQHMVLYKCVLID